jgi:hypothetical protein
MPKRKRTADGATDAAEPVRMRPHRTTAGPFEAATDQTYEVGKIVGQKWGEGKRWYEVQWAGYDDTTWGPMCNLAGCAEQIRASILGGPSNVSIS